MARAANKAASREDFSECWEVKRSQTSLGRRFAGENDSGILHKLKRLPLRVWPGKNQRADLKPRIFWTFLLQDCGTYGDCGDLGGENRWCCYAHGWQWCLASQDSSKFLMFAPLASNHTSFLFFAFWHLLIIKCLFNIPHLVRTFPCQ